MTATRTIHALLTRATEATDAQTRARARQAARAAWASEAIAALKAAQQKVDEAWARTLAAYPEDVDNETIDDLPDPPEQEALDAIQSKIAAVRDHDRWPRHLYWGDV